MSLPDLPFIGQTQWGNPLNAAINARYNEFEALTTTGRLSEDDLKSTFAARQHTHTRAEISDAPAYGRTLMGSANAAEARSTLNITHDSTAGDRLFIAGREVFSDTGWRDISDRLTNVSSGSAHLRREGNRVTFRFLGLTVPEDTSTTTIVITMPTGFRPSGDHVDWVSRDSYSWHIYSLVVQPTGFTRVVGRIEGSTYSVGWQAARPLSGQVTFATFQPWPSTLPGAPL